MATASFPYEPPRYDQTNEKLERELTEAKKQLKEAKKLLEAIAGYCDDTSDTTARQMSAGNVPQGQYAHLRGENQACNVVLRMMNLRGHTRKKPLFRYKKLFKGLMRWI